MVTCSAPARDEALRLLRERFLNRTDLVAIQAPWGKPCPVDANGTLDQLLLGHLVGDEAPVAKVRYTNRRGSGAMKGPFRVGSYCPSLDDTTRWICLDFDGHGHANALADPLATAGVAFDAFSKVGLPVYLERSGGGQGWHLWCFFDPPIAAAKAQALGRALAPRDALLRDGRRADASVNRGIEVFPKQKSRRSGFGNLVWLPWWQGAPAGANTFYQRGTDGRLEVFVPAELAAATTEAVDTLLVSIAPSPSEPQRQAIAAPPLPSTSPPGSTDPVWAEWRQRALAALPIEAVYGTWLTGNGAGAGWLECRDPASPSGDEHPSASVADGTGDAERGAFHSFISGRTLSVFDFLVEHGGVPDFRAARARVAELSHVPEPVAKTGSEAARPEAIGRQRRPRIVIRTDEYAVVDDAIAALAHVEGVYCRGQLLVHVIGDLSRLAGIIRPPHAPRILPLGVAGLRDRLTLAAEWISLKEKQGDVEEVPAHPPAWAAPELEARKSWPGLRSIEGVVESPVLRPDGSVVTRAGYDDRTGLLYQPNVAYPEVPLNPTETQRRTAVAALLDAVCDFPFKSNAHRAAWLTGLLTPLARYAFPGPAPLFLIDANVRGAGKTKLADLIGEIVSGRQIARTSQAPDEAEEIKRITAIALEGDRLMLLDNIDRPLGSGAFDAVLTGTSINERILGKSEKVCLPMLTVWYATGNNVVLRGDTVRRCLHIRLDSDMERPEDRANFKYPDLLGWAHGQRAALVAAALTLLRGYCAAGRPSMGLKPWGSFEGWSALVRNAVVWGGLADPAETRSDLEPSDSESTALCDLLAGWEDLNSEVLPGQRGCTIAQALDAIRRDEGAKSFPRLRAALAELCPHPPGQLPTAKKVGYALRHFRGRVAGEKKLQTRVSGGNNLWFVQHVGEKEPEEPVQAQLIMDTHRPENEG